MFIFKIMFGLTVLNLDGNSFIGIPNHLFMKRLCDKANLRRFDPSVSESE